MQIIIVTEAVRINKHGVFRFLSLTNAYTARMKLIKFYLTLIFAAIRLVQSQYVNSGKVAIKHKGKWEVLRVKYWDEKLGHLACTTLGFPGLIKNLRRLEYRDHDGYDNFGCQNKNNKLVCCPKKTEERHDLPSISQVAVACEQGNKVNGKHIVLIVLYIA